MAKYIGKKVKRSLRILYIKDDSNTTIKTLTNRYDIESAIMEYNREYFQQAYQTKVYEDKMLYRLKEDEMGNKTLQEKLEREDCDDKDVFAFLSLLKQLEYQKLKEHFNPITEEEWKGIVKKAKKWSASSIYSRRTYSLHKCTLASNRITTVLVTHQNIIIK